MLLPGVNTIKQAQTGLRGWDVGAYLSHDADQCNLSDIGALAPHVRPGDYHRSLGIALNDRREAWGTVNMTWTEGSIRYLHVVLNSQIGGWTESLAYLPTGFCFSCKINLHPLQHRARKWVCGYQSGFVLHVSWCVSQTAIVTGSLLLQNSLDIRECVCLFVCVCTCRSVWLGTNWFCSPISRSMAGCLPSLIIICRWSAHTFGLNAENGVG